MLLILGLLLLILESKIYISFGVYSSKSKCVARESLETEVAKGYSHKENFISGIYNKIYCLLSICKTVELADKNVDTYEFNKFSYCSLSCYPTVLLFYVCFITEMLTT